jgi:peptide/nickel transport system ATP-binding protein
MDPDDRMDDAPITGDPPNPINPPSGCRFRTRCPYAERICETMTPVMPEWKDRTTHAVACHMHNPIPGHSLAGNPPPAFGFAADDAPLRAAGAA